MRVDRATEERARAYALAALAGELARVDDAGEGERNQVLNRAAFRAFQLVPSGALTAEEVAAAFEAAGAAAGLSPLEVRGTLWSAARDGQRKPRELRLEPGRRQSSKASQGRVRPAARIAPRPPTAAPRRVTRAELDALWSAALPVGRTAIDPSRTELDGNGYLQHRGWWPPDVAALDLVRILPGPNAYPWPAWWPWGRAGRWTVAALMFEADGSPASLQARAVDLPGWPLPKDKPKARSPLSFETRELLFADAAGLALLRGEGPPPAAVLLAEGLTDTVALALYGARKPERLAVLGLTAGGPPALARVAWPAGMTVVCFTDEDAAGEAYAGLARAALPDSVTFLRARVPHEKEA